LRGRRLKRNKEETRPFLARRGKGFCPKKSGEGYNLQKSASSLRRKEARSWKVIKDEELGEGAWGGAGEDKVKQEAGQMARHHGVSQGDVSNNPGKESKR